MSSLIERSELNDTRYVLSDELRSPRARAEMDWTEPRYERAAIDHAGDVLRRVAGHKAGEVLEAFRVLGNFRASHAFPLNTFQVVLRRRARQIETDALVAQRLKRVPSMIRKLRTQTTMRLSQMQDIGGCRAVLSNVAAAKALRNAYLSGRSNSENVNRKDYVAEPRASGYRSYHLIYRYHCGSATQRAAFNGSLIEIQIRSQIQHAWATAVETVGTLTDQALKASEGSEAWLDFFRNASGLFADFEGTEPVPGLPSDRRSLVKVVRAESRRLAVRTRLRAFRDALRVWEDQKSKNERYFLLDLRPSEENLTIMGFREGEIGRATQLYLEIERDETRSPGSDVVLVRVDSLDALRRAYPNYFVDTEFFLGLLREVTGGGR